MGVALTVAEYLNNQGVIFDVVNHPSTTTALSSAEVSHVPAERFAKAVVLRAERGFLIAVLPASHRIQFPELQELLKEETDMAKEEEIEALFTDCDPGAIPPLGEAYGLKTVVDDSLAAAPDIYFEAGDHENLVHIAGPSFDRLMRRALHGRFTKPVEAARH